MKKIGITGGVGSGKSLVLAHLEEKYHAAVFQADLIAHQVQLPGEECYQKLLTCFGREILREDGLIDRKKLGDIVFADRKKLSLLNSIVHPQVNRRIREIANTEEKKGQNIFVLEAALLTDKIYREILDEIWYIHVVEPVRRKRLRTSRGYSEERIDQIFTSQPSEEIFFNASDYVIENSGDFADTCRQISFRLTGKDQ